MSITLARVTLDLFYLRRVFVYFKIPIFSYLFKEKSLKNKPYKPNKPEKYSKYTHSTLLDDGRISHETVFYNKDGYAMSSTANIYEADNDESIENIYKYNTL